MGPKSLPSKIVADKEFKNNQPTVRNNNIRSSLMTTRQLAESQLTECHVGDMLWYHRFFKMPGPVGGWEAS
jgi:hypothetical protein